MYFSQYSLILFIFLLFCLLSLTQFFKIALSPHFLWDFSSPNGRMAFPFYFFTFFFFSSYHTLHIKSQFVGVEKFDTTRKPSTTSKPSTTNPFKNRSWVEAKLVRVIFGLTRLTCLINKSCLCLTCEPV